jgi:anti-sigma factor RsiW
MSCKSVLWKISAFVDGELPPQERAAVEAHFEVCRDCAQAAEEYKLIDEIAAGEHVPHVRGEEWAGVWDGVLARRSSTVLEGDPAEESPRQRILELPWVPAAWKARNVPNLRTVLPLAAAALLVLAGLLAVRVWWRPSFESPPGSGVVVEPKEDDVPTAEHESGPQPEIEFDEEDGSTHLKYKDF